MSDFFVEKILSPFYLRWKENCVILQKLAKDNQKDKVRIQKRKKEIIIKIHPGVAFIFNLIFPITIMFTAGFQLHWFFLCFTFGILLLSGRYKRAAKVFIFYAVFWFLHSYTHIQDSTFMKGLSVYLMMFMQFIPCLIMASILIWDYNSTEILSALEPVHLPKSFVVAVTVALRYIPTFKREFGYIKESMRLRGIPYTWKKPISSFSYFLVPQLFRCAGLAGEISAAALTKGITNPIRRTSYYQVRMHRYDYAFLAILCIGVVGICVF